MPYRFAPHFKRFRLELVTFFGLLVLFQIPEVVLSLLQRALETSLNERPILQFVLLFPPFCVSAAFSSSFTYALVRKRALKPAWKMLAPRLSLIFTGSLIVGLLLIAAICLFVLPLFYVLAIYLFVPYFILEEPGAKLTAYLFRSSQLARRYLKVCLLTTVACVLMSLLAFFGSEWIGTFLLEHFGDSLITSVLGIGAEIVLSVISALLIDVWLATLYLEICPHE